MTTPRPASPEIALLPVATGRQVRDYLATVIRGRRLLLAATIAAMITESALGLVGPVTIGTITQAVAEHRGTGALAGPLILLAVAGTAGAATGWVSTVLLARTVVPAAATVREHALAAAAELPIDVVEAGGTGDLVARVSGDAELVADTAAGALSNFIGAGLTVAATLVGLAALDWRFALAGLLAVPIQAHTLRWYLRTAPPVYAGGRAADGRRAATLLTSITALPTLRALRLGARQRAGISASSLESMDYKLHAIHISTRFYGRLNLAEVVGLSAILLTGYTLVHTGAATIGAATTAALFFAGLFDPINTVLGVFDTIQQAAAGLARLIGVTSLATPGRSSETHRSLPDRPGITRPVRLEITAARFGYHDGPDVLRGLTVHIEPGRHLAIVGATGSGKSTLAALITGLRTPRAGTATINGVPLNEIDLPQHHVALVTQETHVFATTIAENVRLARPDATDDQLHAALHAVESRDWIARLPNGIDTLVGSGGHPLTPSQAQQLALARVLLLDPPAVVLDEATAEAGSDAARSLDQAAATITHGRTSVVIAHRLTQAINADEIIVMDHGQINEHGTHQQLLATAGTYATLWAAWHHPPPPTTPDRHLTN